MPTHEQSVSWCCHLVTVYSRAYGGRGARAHRPPFRIEIRHEKRPKGMKSTECLHMSKVFLAAVVSSLFTRGHTVGGGTEPFDHPFEPKFGTDNVPQG